MDIRPLDQVAFRLPQTDKPYICTKCGKGLSHIFTMYRYHKTVCGNTSGKWKCKHCSESYKTEGNLMRHLRYGCCDALRQFSCIFCSKLFMQRSSLSRHLKKFHLREMFHNSSEAIPAYSATTTSGPSSNDNDNLNTFLRHLKAFHPEIMNKSSVHNLKLHKINTFTNTNTFSRPLKAFHPEMIHKSSVHNLEMHNINAAMRRKLILTDNDSDSAHGSSSDRNQSCDGLVAQRELDSASNDSNCLTDNAGPQINAEDARAT